MKKVTYVCDSCLADMDEDRRAGDVVYRDLDLPGWGYGGGVHVSMTINPNTEHMCSGCREDFEERVADWLEELGQ